MPKRIKNLYPQLLSFELMYASWLKASKGKRNRHEVLRYNQRLEANLWGLIEQLENGTYSMGGYKSFWISEPKRRIVAKLRSFDDRVLQHALHAIIEPIYESVFISDSFACRKNKGTHAGADRAQQMVRKVKREHGKVYSLKCDIAGYFANIDHAILKQLLRKKIGDNRLLALLDLIIDSHGDGKGLPLGNLTSQLLANIYLNELDYLAKHELGVKCYIRYMDDFVLLHHDKAFLHDCWETIQVFLEQSLALKLNRKTALFPVNGRARSVDFLGYRILSNSRKLRRSAIDAMRRKVNKLRNEYSVGEISLADVRHGMASHIAHASNADSVGVLSELLNKPFVRVYL